MSTYEAQSARDAAECAARSGHCSLSYAAYLEEAALRHRDYFLARGDAAMAEAMMTRTLSESLMGNDGD